MSASESLLLRKLLTKFTLTLPYSTVISTFHFSSRKTKLIERNGRRVSIVVNEMNKQIK